MAARGKREEELVEIPRRVPRSIEARRVERQLALSAPRGRAAELKYYTAINNMGLVSSNVWNAMVSSAGPFNAIVQGTEQNQRLGRRIRVHRYRMVVYPSDMAADSLLGAYTVTRTDSNIASSDLFVSSGGSLSQCDYPNPVGQSAVHAHTCGTVQQLVGGGAFGTTPSYGSLTIIHDVNFRKGMPVEYDVSGATGPLPMTYVSVGETSITLNYAVQVWFTDA